jgi:hypothetical protein
MLDPQLVNHLCDEAVDDTVGTTGTVVGHRLAESVRVAVDGISLIQAVLQCGAVSVAHDLPPASVCADRRTEVRCNASRISSGNGITPPVRP